MTYIARKIKVYRNAKNLPEYKDLISGKCDISQASKKRYRVIPTTYTRLANDTKENYIKSVARKIYQVYYQGLDVFFKRNECLIGPDNYRNYQIPKKTGGFRTISEPNISLKNYQYKIIELFNYIAKKSEVEMYHASAYAFLKKRNILSCLNKHKYNDSNWFLKLDIHDCFGTTDLETAITQMSKIYPFNSILKDGYLYEWVRCSLNRIIETCFLNNGLPQGAPTSPILLNLIMLPFDYEISKKLNKRGFVYTRYADDIIISHKCKFNFAEIVKIVEETFRENGYKYQINSRKTRYGSRAGRNWNLGLMLNKDNDITIGWKKKKEFKAMLTNACFNIMTCSEKYHLNGIISYYKMIDKEYTEYVINHISTKFNVDLKEKLKE